MTVFDDDMYLMTTVFDDVLLLYDLSISINDICY